MKTKKINVFDQTPRNIKCIKNSFEFFDEIFIEDKLQIGNIYFLEKVSMQPYGDMVFLKGIENRYGFQSSLFEELEEYDTEFYKQNYEKWLFDKLEEGRKDIENGKVTDIEDTFQKLRKEIK